MGAKPPKHPPPVASSVAHGSASTSPRCPCSFPSEVAPAIAPHPAARLSSPVPAQEMSPATESPDVAPPKVGRACDLILSQFSRHPPTGQWDQSSWAWPAPCHTITTSLYH